MQDLALKLITTCIEKKLKIAIAESCTGGMICAGITSIPGSSEVFDQGFITYSYDSKSNTLGVPVSLLQKHGAVSAEVATAMAKGAADRSSAHLTLSVTGIAGPGGATPNKPVGLVYFAIYKDGTVQSYKKHFQGNREQVRHAAALYGIQLLLDNVAKPL